MSMGYYSNFIWWKQGELGPVILDQLHKKNPNNGTGGHLRFLTRSTGGAKNDTETGSWNQFFVSKRNSPQVITMSVDQIFPGTLARTRAARKENGSISPAHHPSCANQRHKLSFRFLFCCTYSIFVAPFPNFTLMSVSSIYRIWLDFMRLYLI